MDDMGKADVFIGFAVCATVKALSASNGQKKGATEKGNP
jgi:hypothetical protein